MIKTSDGVTITLGEHGITFYRLKEYEDETGRHSEHQSIYIGYKDLDKINAALNQDSDRE
jgi:hypothetical protein